MQTTPLFSRLRNCNSRFVVCQGGTGAGKTFAILQLLFLKAIAQAGIIVTVVGQDVPNLKAGALRQAASVIEPLAAFIAGYNATDRIFTLRNGSIIEFKSYADEQDAKSGKRQYLFVNEADGVEYAVFWQLAIRTDSQIFIDYNPSIEFWAHTKVCGKPDSTLFITDHRHNPFLAPSIHDEIESISDPELFRVYARGLTGMVTGLILPNTNICDGIPEDARLVGYGMDFGFTNDPTACVGVWLSSGELWVDELVYSTGLTNPEIATLLLPLAGENKIVCDSAEPKSIAELNALGLWCVPATKGPDSVVAGIDILKRYRINITHNSRGLLFERKAYIWKNDRHGNPTNQPIDRHNHGFDALRYCTTAHLSKRKTKELWAY